MLRTANPVNHSEISHRVSEIELKDYARITLGLRKSEVPGRARNAGALRRSNTPSKTHSSTGFDHALLRR